MTEVRWDRYPLVAGYPATRSWLSIQGAVGLAPNTVDAYGRALHDYLRYCRDHDIAADTATREHVVGYVGELVQRPHPHGTNVVAFDSGAGLANATLQQRLVALRLFYDYLVEEGQRDVNPVGRGRYTAGRGFGGQRARGLVPRFTKLPWIPSDEQWQAIIAAMREESVRNRLMFALGYDAALRREELCALCTEDLDPAYRTVRVRAETTKNRRERIVPYSAVTGELLRAYLAHRRTLSLARGPLFLSESRRNYAAPLSLWTWSKVVHALALRASVPQFSTHTLRHLCLTDLARAGWELHAIATFAGHRNPATTLQYIHLSGRELAEKLARGMEQIHAWRVRTLTEAAQAVEPVR